MLALRPMMPFQTVEPVPRTKKVGACATPAVVALTKSPVTVKILPFSRLFEKVALLLPEAFVMLPVIERLNWPATTNAELLAQLIALEIARSAP